MELDSVYDTLHPEKGLLEGEVGIDYDVFSFGRNTSRTEHDDAIQVLWDEKTSGSQTRVYNASKFRLQGLGVDPELNRFVLRVGLTDYRDLLGTHYSKHTKQMVQDGVKDSDGKGKCKVFFKGVVFVKK